MQPIIRQEPFVWQRSALTEETATESRSYDQLIDSLFLELTPAQLVRIEQVLLNKRSGNDCNFRQLGRAVLMWAGDELAEFIRTQIPDAARMVGIITVDWFRKHHDLHRAAWEAISSQHRLADNIYKSRGCPEQTHLTYRLKTLKEKMTEWSNFFGKERKA